jgi:signal transduction histidine kinase
VSRRFLAASLGLILVVLLVLVVPLGLSFAQRERDDLLAAVERDAVAIAFFVEDELDPEATDVGIDLQAVADGYEARTGGRVVIVDAEGVVLADSDPRAGADPAGRDFSSRPEVATALDGEVARGTRSSTTLGGRFVFVAVPVASGGQVDGAVRITYPTSEVDERVRRNWLVLGGLSAVTLATATVVALVLASSVTRPLRRLQAAATDLGAGDLAARAPDEDGPPEVRDVAAAFNRMAERLGELVVAQDQFVADASHELRTPLTALRLRLEVLPVDGTAAVDDLEAALTEVERLGRMVDALLALARADRADRVEGAVPVALGPFIEERRDAWLPLAVDAGVDLGVVVEGEPVARTAPDRLAQVLDNLIANALEVAPAGSAVVLQARAAGARSQVHVVDAGPGMPPEDRARAFDRFWRGRGAARRTDGSGLGLAIVQKLVQVDGGTVRLDAAPTGGIDAVVDYPAG